MIIFYSNYLISVKDVAVNVAEKLYSRGCYCVYVMFSVACQHYSKLLLK